MRLAEMLDRSVLRCAAPGMLLAAVCLLPFLQKAFTIDDPCFLIEAHQALRTPLTPAATDMCWDNVGFPRPISEIGSPGPAMGYAMVPVALLGDKEGVAHLIVLILLCIAVMATVSLAFRCGAEPMEAMLAGLFFASCPVVLAMAGTVMPDILAAALGVIGLERLLAWKAEGSIWQAAAAGVALGLAPLARSNTILLVPVAIVMLAGGGSFAQRLQGLRKTWPPILIALVCFAALSWITSVHTGESAGIFPNGPNPDQIGARFAVANLLEFGLNWMVVTPFAIAWLLLDGLSGIALFAVGVLFGGLLKFTSPTSPVLLDVLGAVGLIAVGSVVLWAWRTQRPPLAALSLCLLIALPMIVYMRLPSKYLVPCVPAAAILLAVRISKSSRAIQFAAVGLVLVGAALGITILRADADFAGLARRAVAEGISEQIHAGHRAWYSGQWALTWYAEHAGATCLSIYAPYPAPGDVVIAGELEGGVGLVAHLNKKLRLLQTIQVTEPGVRIMNPMARVGFYSNDIGYLPWRWSDLPLNTYYIWVVE
jgi:hypothetical protein